MRRMRLPALPTLPEFIPVHLRARSGNQKYQVSAGVKKRFSEMTDVEMARVVAAGWAEALMMFPEFEERAARDPEWAARVQHNAAKVKAIEGTKT